MDQVSQHNFTLPSYAKSKQVVAVVNDTAKILKALDEEHPEPDIEPIVRCIVEKGVD